MNRAFKSLWNGKTKTFVAVAETTANKGKRSSSQVSATAKVSNGLTHILLTIGLSAMALAVQAEVDTTHYFSVNDYGSIKLNHANDGATGLDSLAAGVKTQAAGDRATALGNSANAADNHATAIGTASTASGKGSTAVGWKSKATALSSTALGQQTKATQKFSTAVGYKAEATGTNSTALGKEARASAANSTALGRNSTASALRSTAVGSGANASGISSHAMGTAAQASAADSIAMGTRAQASGLASLALGREAAASGQQAIAVGVGTVASKYKTTALGAGAKATGAESIAIGRAQAQDTRAIALGNDAVASKINAIAIGAEANANGSNAIAIGRSQAGTNAIAMGAKATAGRESLALGAGSEASFQGSVALGRNSVTAAAVQTPGMIINGQTYQFAGANPTSTVSVGNVGSERTITNVAAGRISSTSTDAINGSQLHATNTAIASFGDRAVKYDGSTGDAKSTITLEGINGTTITNVAAGKIAANSKDAVNGGQISNVGDSIAAGMGGGSKFENGVLITDLNFDGNNYSSVNDALGGVHQTLSTQVMSVGELASAGWELTDEQGKTARVAPNSQVKFTGDQNVSVAQTGSDNNAQVEVKLNQNVRLNSITAVSVDAARMTANEIAINNNGPVINDSGIDMRNKQITNVAAGVAATDAVNMSQLEGVDNQLRGEIGNVRRDLHKTDRKLRAGVASAIATASIPQAYLPGKSTLGIGTGTWNGESGLALGVSKITNDGKWIVKLSGNADTRGTYGGGMGASYQW